MSETPKLEDAIATNESITNTPQKMCPHLMDGQSMNRHSKLAKYRGKRIIRVIQRCQIIVALMLSAYSFTIIDSLMIQVIALG